MPSRLRARDAISRTRMCVRCSGWNRAAKSATYNVGTEQPSSVRDVLAAVERASGKSVPLRVAPRRAGDPAVLYASASAHPERAGMGAAPRCARRHRRRRVAMALDTSARLSRDDAIMSKIRGVLDDPLLSVVMPAFNESATIEEIVRRVTGRAASGRSSSWWTTPPPTAHGRHCSGLQQELGFTLLLAAAQSGQGRRVAPGVRGRARRPGRHPGRRPGVFAGRISRC